MRVYLVGGAIRDRLLGLPVHERDWVVTGATPEDMRAGGFLPIDGTFPVFRHPETGDEYALARIEHKQGSGHRGFDFECGPHITLEQDLARRDLSVNAIAEDDEGNCTDPFDGLGALRERRLAHLTEAYADDPLRLLRTARFAACLAHLGFRVDPPTLAVMRQMTQSGELGSLSAARTWRETDRALRSPTPRVFFDVLEECGAAPELLPPPVATALRPHGRPLSTLQAVAESSEDTDSRFAALIVSALAEQGVADVVAVARAMHAPATAVRMVSRIASMLVALQRRGAQDADYWLCVVEAGDGLRQSSEFRRSLPVISAMTDQAEGKTSIANTLLNVQTTAESVDTAAIAAIGLRGSEFGRALRESRLAAVAGTLP